MTKTITFRHEVDGALADVNSCVLSDPTGAFGLRRTDTGEVIVADATALTHVSTGVYSIQVTGLVASVTYEYWIEWVYIGETSRQQRIFTQAAAAAAAPAYLTLSEADELAATMLGLTAWAAAADDQQTAALAQASMDIDGGGPWQGQKYDATQALEFPRYYSAVQWCVWDWNTTMTAAVVPDRVKRACLVQANSLLAGDRDGRKDAMHDGLQAQSTGGMSETYSKPGNGGEAPVLCRAAAELMKIYRLRTGRLL